MVLPSDFNWLNNLDERIVWVTYDGSAGFIGPKGFVGLVLSNGVHGTKLLNVWNG